MINAEDTTIREAGSRFRFPQKPHPGSQTVVIHIVSRGEKRIRACP